MKNQFNGTMVHRTHPQVSVNRDKETTELSKADRADGGSEKHKAGM